MADFDRPALEARLAKITPGEWKAEDIGAGTHAIGVISDSGRIIVEHDFISEPDAELLAHAPADLRSCLAEIDRLTTERDAASTRAEDWLDAHHVSERRLKESQAEVSRLSAEITRLREEEQASRDQVVLLGPLLLELAGFLRLQADGAVPVPAHASREAAELLDKVGTILSLTEG